MKLRSAKNEQVKQETAASLAAAAAELETESRRVAADLPGRVAALAQTLAEKILGRKVAA
jgi:F0F1-type ATP synthase membrane subunit b/b'